MRGAVKDAAGTCSAWFARLARIQARRPFPFLLAGLLLAAAFGALAFRLTLRPEFEQLLPQASPSVVEMRRLRERLDQGSVISVVLDGGGAPALRRAGDAVVARLAAARPRWLVDVADGVQVARDFLMPRAALFANREALERVRDELRGYRSAVVRNAAGLDLGIEAPPRPPDAERILASLVPEDARTALGERWPDGYFQDADGRSLVVLVRTSIAPGDLAPAQAALKLTRQLVEECLRDPGLAGVHAAYAGDVVTGLAEYGAVRRDLTSLGPAGVALVLLVILVFFQRLRALVVLGVAIGVGLALTFGVTQLAIGQLNVATAFLVSVVAGNGINAGIIYMARYIEARRAGAGTARALATASSATWLATFGAAAAASAAYASLGLTSFLGLRHFAVIGGSGMLLCWAATYLVAPPTLALIERRWPLRFDEAGEGRLRAALRRAGERCSAALLAAATRAPLAVAVACALLTAATGSLAVRWLRSDPMEYDMRRIGNDPWNGADLRRASATARRVLGLNLESSMVVLADRLDQVIPLQRALEARRDAAPAAARPFQAVHTLLDFVPRGQPAKIPLIEEIARLLRSFRARGAIPDAQWARLAALLPPSGLRPFGLEDLPEPLARRFSERDGTRGTVLYVEPTAGEDESDLRYLMRFADAFRETKLPGGEIIRGSGRAVLFADIFRTVVAEIPGVLALSFASTVVAVLVTFRRGGLTALVLSSLLTGVAWLFALLEVSRLRLNFINFVALPVTFGIGVEYALNIVQRYASGEGMRDALRGTGAAVVLCSLTTIVSYLVLLTSVNQAVRSLGAVAVLGECCCLTVAVLALPAALLCRERSGARRVGQPARR